MERDPYMATRPAEGCVLAVGVSCLFWGLVLLIWLAWKWGWI